MGVHCDLVLGGIANQALTLREGDIRRCGTITLVVRDDFNAIILPDTNATELGVGMGKKTGREEIGSRVGCAKINTNSFGGGHCCCSGRVRRVGGVRVDANQSFYN
jgi:hypothetical protein